MDLYLIRFGDKVNRWGVMYDPNVSLKEVESRWIRKSLEYHGGSLSLSSRRLGVSRATMYRKIKEYGLFDWLKAYRKRYVTPVRAE